MSTTIFAVDAANFEAEVVDSPVPVLIDFWAPWCSPCQALLPVLEALAPMYADCLKVVKIDIDKSPDLKDKYSIRSIPQLCLTNGGEQVARLMARTRTQLAAELDDLLP